MHSNEHPVLKQIFTNIGWLFFDKALRAGVGVVVVTMLARYLGPELFGKLNFATALVAIFGALATLGLRGVVVRDLLDQPGKMKITLGTTFILRITAAVLFYILLLAYIFVTESHDILTKSLIAIIGLSIVFRATDVVSFWFESQVNSKYIVWVENSTFLVASSVKLVMIWQHASLISFAYVILIESIVVGFALLFVYAKIAFNPLHWQVTKKKAKWLFRNSWPLILSSASWIIYTRIDQIMIGEMLTSQAVGNYSVAIRLTDAASIIPVSIALSIIPAITSLRKTNNTLYHERFQITYDVTVGLMVLLAVCISILSAKIIHLLFGPQYAQAASVLRIYIWSTIFIAMATVSGKYLLNEGLQKITMQRHAMGILINIPLNLIVIPVYGIEGAAFTSLFSLAFCNYFFDAITPNTRLCFIQKTRSFIAFGLLKHALKRTAF